MRSKDRPIEILLVEDNLDHAELVKRSLECHSIANRITHLGDGEQVVQWIERYDGLPADRSGGPEFDLVLLDLRLPKVDGLDVLAVIKNHSGCTRVPVVILTTSEAERDLARAYELQANAYVVKPIDFAEFGDLMRDLGLFWLAWNQRPRSSDSRGDHQQP